MRTNLLTTMCLVHLTTLGCERSRDVIVPDPDGPEQVSAESSADGILSVTLDFDYTNREITTRLDRVPEKASLSCALEQEEIKACGDNRSFAMPENPGTYRFSVLAKEGDNIVGVGEVKFRLGESSEGASTIARRTNYNYHSSLTLEIDDSMRVHGQPFANGMAIKRNTPIDLHFRFKQPPGCEAQLRCRSDRRDAQFNPLCSGTRHQSFNGGTMAKGLQFFTVQASCGDRIGEPLVLHWYGVPQNYSYMGLQAITVRSTKRYFFQLMRTADCPENKLTFECRNSDNDPFATCENHVDNPPADFAIRPLCNGKPYPHYGISELASTP